MKYVYFDKTVLATHDDVKMNSRSHLYIFFSSSFLRTEIAFYLQKILSVSTNFYFLNLLKIIC